MWGLEFNYNLIEAGTLLGWLTLPKIRSHFSMYPCTKEEEVVWQSWIIPRKPSFRPCTYSIPLTSLLFGSGLVEVGFIEYCWTTEVVGGMWMTLWWYEWWKQGFQSCGSLNSLPVAIGDPLWDGLRGTNWLTFGILRLGAWEGRTSEGHWS